MSNEPQTKTIITIFTGIVILLILMNLDWEGLGNAFTGVALFVVSTKKFLIAFAGLIVLAFLVTYAITTADAFRKILKDTRYVNAINYFLSWTDGADDAFRKRFDESYLKNKKRCICFGILYDKQTPLGSFLAFSDDNDNHNKLGRRFQEEKQGIPRFFCEYSYEKLEGLVPVAIPGPDDEAIIPSGELFDIHKTRQTCAERKVVAKLKELYGDEFQNLGTQRAELILLMTFTPCPYCAVMIKGINKEFGDRLQIHSIYVDLIRYFLREKEALLREKKEYEKSINSYHRFYQLFAKPEVVKPDADVNSTKSEVSKQEEHAKKMVRDIAIRMGKTMAQEGLSDVQIKSILGGLLSTDGSAEGLTEDQINMIIAKFVEPLIRKK